MARESFVRAIELPQAKLDAQISLSNPTEIQNGLITSAREAAEKTGKISGVNNDPAMKKLLTDQEELETKLLVCLAII